MKFKSTLLAAASALLFNTRRAFTCDAFTMSAAVRTARMQAMVTALGANATCTAYNGTKPSALGTPTGTLLATLAFGTTVIAANGGAAGSVTNGVLTFGGFTQNSATFANGTATFLRFATSGGVVIADIDVGVGAGNAQISAPIAVNQNITGSIVVTDGNLAT